MADDVLVEELRERLATVKERVEYILRNYPESRNDDRYLWLLYVRLFEPELSKYIKFVPYEVLKSVVSFETIRRVRQLIQAEGKYLPTDPEVLRKRRRLAEAMRVAVQEV